jgi:lipopolysaccharide assembly protein A
MKFSSSLSWLLRGLLFVAVLALALMNMDPVVLRFFFGQTWQLPMIVALLLVFALGAAFGVLACLSRLFRQRREIQRLKRELRPAVKQTLPPPDAG